MTVESESQVCKMQKKRAEKSSKEQNEKKEKKQKKRKREEKSRMELGCTIITVDIYSKVFAMNEGADRDQMCNNDCRE